jgi:Amt family ammonium transporter
MNNADIAWMLVATALVLLMTPALAFFYGGMVRSKNALNTMMMSFAALGPVAVAWALAGYSLAFATGGAFVGSLEFAGLRHVGLDAQGAIPHLLFMAFQGTFAVITAALISGAVVERLRFGSYLAFIVVWMLAVYAPVAHGCGTAGSWPATARWISPAARSCTSTRRRPPWSPRWSSARARTTGVTRCSRTACR